MLVLGGLVLGRENIVSLHLTYHRKAVYKVLGILRDNLSVFFNKVGLVELLLGFGLILIIVVVFTVFIVTLFIPLF